MAEYNSSFTGKEIDERLSKAGTAMQPPATAKAGQGIAVEAVDGSGKPTIWKAVDLSNVKNVKTDFVFESGKPVRVLIVEYLDGTYEQFGVGDGNTDTILYPNLSEDGVLSWRFYDATVAVPVPADMAIATQEMLSELSAEIDDVDGRFERVETQTANRLDESAVTLGYAVNHGNGTLYENATYGTTDYIPVSPGETITFQVSAAGSEMNTQIISMAYIAAYDQDKNFVAGASWASSYAVPDGVAYMRFSAAYLVSGTYPQRMVAASDALVKYEPYGFIITRVLKPEYNNDEHINSVVEERVSEYFETVEVSGRNLLDPNAVEPGYYVNPKWGTLATNASYATSGYIPVEAGKTYTFQIANALTPNYTSFLNMGFFAVYDENKKVVVDGGGSGVSSYTPPDGVAYIRLSATHFVSHSTDLRMFVASDELIPYEPYSVTVEQLLKPEHSNNDHINSLIDAKVGFVSEVNAYLPKHLYCAVGRTIELYNNQVCLQADRFHMAWSCSIGKALKRKFSVTGADAQIGDYTLSLKIYNDKQEIMWKGSSTLHIVSASITAAHSVCPIGDSLTNIKPWMAEVMTLSNSKISFVGTYPWSADDAAGNRLSGKQEGRSGFSAKNYINGDPYTYSGATESPNNVFWDGSRFNWATYKTASGLTPDAVQIFLGTNGLGEDNTENAGYIKQMVDYIRQDDANIPIFVVNTIYRSNQNGIGVQQSTDGYAALSGVWKYNEDRKIMNLMEILDGLLDGYSNLYMVNLALTHDSEYNFGAVETAVNPRAAQTEFMPTESVHPQTQGYFQMADVIFSVYAAAFG